MFKTWDEMTVVEQLQCTFSDYHKDVYGFRPRYMTAEQWNSEQWLREEISKLDMAAMCEAEAEQQRQAIAIQDFEEAVLTSIQAGAADRATAIRWLQQATNTEDDVGYFEYISGLPYGYTTRVIH